MDSMEDNVYLDPVDVDEVIELGETKSHDALEGAMSEVDIKDNEVDETTAQTAVDDQSFFTFNAHKDSVFTVRINQSDTSIIASGGQDDIAHVWNSNDGQILFSTTGHHDSVTCIEFNHNQTMLATADMAGTVIVWSIPQGRQLCSFDITDIEWLKWHRLANVLLCGTADGDIWLWKIPSSECKTFLGSGQACTCSTLFTDGIRAAAGYANGEVRIWDLMSGNCLTTLSGIHGHQDAVVSMDSYHDDTLLITGAADGFVKLIKSSGKVVTEFNLSKNSTSDEKNGVETVAFSKKHSYAAVGTLHGNIYILDITNQKIRHTLDFGTAIVKVLWHQTDPIVYFACVDGYIRSLDARSGTVLDKLSGHTDSILDFDISINGEVLVTCSDDHTAKVYKLR